MKHPVRIAALAALGLLLMLSGLAAQRASAHDSHPGLQFSIDIKGLDACTSRVRDPTCTLAVGSQFTLQVNLDNMGDGISQYDGFDLYLRHTGVTPNQDASMDAWPDCGFPASLYGTGFIGFGCAIGIPPAGPSSYLGVIATNTFKCTQSGTITLVHGLANSDLVEDVGLLHTEVDADETINVVCGQVPPGQTGIVATATEGGPRNDTPPPPGTAQPQTPTTQKPTLEPTAAAQATAAAIAAQKTATASSGTVIPGGGGPGGSDNGGSSHTWVWIVVGIAGAAAVLAAAGGGWWYMRSKSGGGTPGAPTAT
jgi:hypothetical protein